MFTASKDAANDMSNDISGAIKSTKKDVYNTVYEAGEDIRDAATTGARKARRLFNSATEEACHAAKNLSNQIEDNPKQAVLVSICAGFLLGALVRR